MIEEKPKLVKISDGCFLDIEEHQKQIVESNNSGLEIYPYKKNYEHEITETHKCDFVSEGNKSFFLKMGKGKMFMNGKEIK